MNKENEVGHDTMTGLLDWRVGRWWQTLRQWLCNHECRLEDMQQVSQTRVDCVCLKCGTNLSAPFGLALPCKWIDYRKFKRVPLRG